jgi:hypothetical protein
VIVGIVSKALSLFKRHKLHDTTPWDMVPSREYRTAIHSPLFREKLRELSIHEDEENSYYTGILNIISESCVGTVPHLLGQHDSNAVNDSTEDKWLEWCIFHHIGAALREMRREAAMTGIGIVIPYLRKTSSYQIKLALKNVSVTQLRTPPLIDNDIDIFDGIEYDENGDIAAIWVGDDNLGDPKRYTVPDEAIVWKKPKMAIVPECGSAFCLFPSVRRFMKAIVRGEELRSAIPMAVELDPTIYRPEDADEIPTGAFEYQPGMVPTLPPGTKLTGISVTPQSEERKAFIELVIAAAARCKQMPKNIALGDSSGHNMATAQVDIEPWKNTVEIDRHDFEPVIRQLFIKWAEYVVLVDGYLPPYARSGLEVFTYSLNYKRLFSHPDPAKKANARITDLMSGSTTLHRILTEEGLNPRRELEREARLLDLTKEEYVKMLIAGRTPAALEVLKLLPTDQGNEANQ